MNKNLLIKQNNELFDKIKILKNKNSMLLSQINTLNSQKREFEIRIALLEEEIERLKALNIEPVSEPVVLESADVTQETEPKVIEKEAVELSDEFNFASDVIGNIVIKAAGYINLLTESDNDNKKELINLILGRTEIAKAEVLNIISSDVSFEAKKDLINTQFEEAIEYFKSIMEQ